MDDTITRSRDTFFNIRGELVRLFFGLIFNIIYLPYITVQVAPPTVNPVYPIKASPNGRYMIDQQNHPFMIIGDSPHSIVVNLSESDVATYMSDRQAHGFNSLWVQVLDNTYTGGRSNGSTYDGIIPFTKPGDFSTPNEAYFKRVDNVVQSAGSHGMIVFLDPVDTGGWITSIKQNGPTKDYNFGYFLGNRYKNYPNIVWLNGNDFQTWTDSTDNADVKAIMQGIHDADPNHAQTIELNYFVSGSQDDTLVKPLLNLSAAYTYYPTYAEVLSEYNRATMPVFMVEAHYEGESISGDSGTPSVLRRQEYWAMLSGATGQLYGSQYWRFQSGWQQGMDSIGVQQYRYVTALFQPRQWYNLVPDQSHTLVTAGLGNYSPNCSTFTSGCTPSTNNYLTAAKTPDGSLAIAYMPTIRTITVNMAQLAGPTTAHWYDPTNGTYINVAGSPFANTGTQKFTPPGNNSAGDGDWVLVLETSLVSLAPTPASTATATLTPGPMPTATAAPLPTATPKPAGIQFIQANGATPQSPQSTVNVPYNQSQAADDTNILAIGWNDTTSSINSVTDSAGNIYHVAAATFRGNGISQAIYYATNIKAGANTVTVTFNQAVQYPDVRNLEYSGINTTNPLDVSSSNTGTAVTASSGNATTTASNELIFAAGTTLVAFNSPGPGFTSRILTSPDADIAEDELVSSISTYNASAVQNSSGGWVMQMATFRAAGN